MRSEKFIRKIIKIENKHIWHPFTQMADWQKEEPLIIEAGSGVYLTDARGRKYIDGVSSLWVNIHGHNDPDINRAVTGQLKKIAHSTFLGLTHVPAVRLAEKLIKIVPDGLTRVFYSDNGSTAVEIALKMAYQYWKQKNGRRETGDGRRKNKFLSLKNAYHGDTIGSVSVGGIDLFHEKFRPLLFDVLFAPSPYCYRCPYRDLKSDNKKQISQNREQSHPDIWQKEMNRLDAYNKSFQKYCRQMECAGYCIKAVEDILSKHHKDIAAAVIEPIIQAAAGMITMPPGYMTEFSKLCRKYDILLIVDEVATGFGHTGKMFACDIENIRPDFLCIAKGITGGYLPLAATITTEEIYKAFLGKYDEFKTFFHGHTYTANPLACAAAIANLEIFERRKVLEKLGPKIKCLTDELKTLSDNKYVGEIRQCGFMAGIEIVKDKKSKEPFPPSEKTAIKICQNAREYGVILRPLGNVVVILPPLSAEKSHIKKIVSAIKYSIGKTIDKNS